MLVLGMLFGVLVAGPLLVLGALALAHSERALPWLDGLRRRGRQPAGSPVSGEVSGEAQAASDDVGAPVDATAIGEAANGL